MTGSMVWRQASRVVAGSAGVAFCYTAYLVLDISFAGNLIWFAAGTLLIAAEIAALAGLVVTAHRTQRPVMGMAGLVLFGGALANIYVLFVVAATVVI